MANSSVVKLLKSHILRFRVRDRKNFNEIKRGLKIVETRAATERYRKINAGDQLIFACGKSRLLKIVSRVRHFSTIDKMVKVLNFKKIMPSVENIAEMKNSYHGYPGYKKKIKKFGIVAFWLK